MVIDEESLNSGSLECLSTVPQVVASAFIRRW